MAKYDPLKDELFRLGAQRVSMSFGEVEQLVGPLPGSARQYEWWWANEDHRTTRHVQCKAWGEPGYEAEADLRRQQVVFTRT